MPINSALFLGCVQRSMGVKMVVLDVQLKRCSVVWSSILQSWHRMLFAVSNLEIVDYNKKLYPDLSWANVLLVCLRRDFQFSFLNVNCGGVVNLKLYLQDTYFCSQCEHRHESS